MSIEGKIYSNGNKYFIVRKVDGGQEIIVEWLDDNLKGKGKTKNFLASPWPPTGYKEFGESGDDPTPHESPSSSFTFTLDANGNLIVSQKGKTVSKFDVRGPQGNSGKSGEKGPRGDQGIQGPQGIPGIDGNTWIPVITNDGESLYFQNDKGDKTETFHIRGARGDKGDQGLPGDRGERGEQGVPGINGQNGDTWIPEVSADGKSIIFRSSKGETKGPFSIRGEKGAQGPQGEKGDPGSKGDQGAPGPKGEDAETWTPVVSDDGESLQFISNKGNKSPVFNIRGAQGLQGVQGIPGVKGDNGRTFTPHYDGEWLWFEDESGNRPFRPVHVKGDKGDEGKRGKSAFEIWRDDPLHPENADKTVDDFLLSLKGEDGRVVNTYHNELYELEDYTCPIQRINPNMIVSSDNLEGAQTAEETIELEKAKIANIRKEGEKYHNHGSWIQEFFWWCAGADRPLLRMCPGEHSKYMGIGTVIFFTALMAWFSSFVALGFVTGESDSTKDIYEILIPVISLLLISFLCFFGYKFHKLKRKENYLQSELSHECQKQIVDEETIRLELEKSKKTSQIKGTGAKMIFITLSFVFIAFTSIILFKDGFDGFMEYVKDYWLIAIILGIEVLIFSRLLINNKKQLEELKQDLYNEELNISEKSSQTSPKVILDNILNLRRGVRQSELDVRLLVIKFFLVVVFTILLGVAVSSNFSISWAAFFACAWSLMIFFLDRFITNTMYSDGKVTISWLELRSALPRIIIAIFLGIVISAPLELNIFRQEIDAKLLEKFRAEVSTRLEEDINNNEEIKLATAKLKSQQGICSQDSIKYFSTKYNYGDTTLYGKNEQRTTGKSNNSSSDLKKDDEGRTYKVPTMEESITYENKTVFDEDKYQRALTNDSIAFYESVQKRDNLLGTLKDLRTNQQYTLLLDSVYNPNYLVRHAGLYDRLQALHELAYTDKDGNSTYSEWPDKWYTSWLFWTICIWVLLSLTCLQFYGNAMVDKEEGDDSAESEQKDVPLFSKLWWKGFFIINPWIAAIALLCGCCNQILFNALPCFIFSAVGMIMMLFILIDISPVFYKMMLADGIYDKLLHKEKLLTEDAVRLSAAKSYAKVNNSSIGRLAPFVFGKTSKKIYKILKSKRYNDVDHDIDGRPEMGYGTDEEMEALNRENKDIFNYVLSLKKRLIQSAYLAWYRDMRDHVLAQREDRQNPPTAPTDMFPELDDENQPVISIILDKTKLEMSIDDEEIINATISPASMVHLDISWKSEDDDIVTVDNGVIKAHGLGTTQIIASCGSLTSSCEVTVIDGAGDTDDDDESNQPAGEPTGSDSEYPFGDDNDDYESEEGDPTDTNDPDDKDDLNDTLRI